MADMFSTLAKGTTTKKTTKKNDKPVIKVAGDDFDQNLNLFVDVKKQFDEAKTQLTLVQGVIKETVLDKWCKLYKDNGSYPGSVLVTSDSNASFMFAPSDKYLTLDDERATELKDEFGDDIVEEDVTFAFNSDLLAKYAEVLTDLIQGSDDISDDDKANLIVATKKINVSKGSIEKALTVGKGDVEDYLRKISPVYSLRTPKKGK